MWQLCHFRFQTEYLMHCKQRFNRHAIIVMPLVLHLEYEWYLSYFFIAGHLVVPDVLRWTLCASRSGHDIAGSGLQTDLPLEELPRSAALHAGLQAMWRWTCARLTGLSRTCARLRNRHNARTRSVTLRRRSGSSREPSPTAHERKRAHAKDLSHAHVLCTGTPAWQIHKGNHERRRK